MSLWHKVVPLAAAALLLAAMWLPSGPVLTLIQARRLKRRRELGLEPEAASEAKQPEDPENKLDSPNTPV